MADGRSPPARPLGPVLAPEEMALWADARAALEGARQEAARILEAAQTQAEALQQELAQAAARRHAEELSAVLADATRRAAAHAERLERDLPRLLMTAVSRLIGEIPREELLARAVRHALGRFRAGSRAHLHVRPEDMAAAEAALRDLRTVISIVCDETLAPGSCLLETEFGTAELGLQSQMKILSHALGMASA